MSQIIKDRVACCLNGMSILRLWRAAVLNLRIACVAVSNLGIWGPYKVDDAVTVLILVFVSNYFGIKSCCVTCVTKRIMKHTFGSLCGQTEG